MSNKICAVIQARMGSSRLPGKILHDIAGQPMLVRVVERARYATTLDEIVVATTTAGDDDQVVALCEARGYPYVRGSVDDVLSRYILASRTFKPETIVRLTADCPLIDPGVIDQTVNAFISSIPPADYGSNRIVRTFPIGLDVEIMTSQALERSNDEAHQDYHREHVTPYMYEQDGRFRVVSVEADMEYGAQRWTVDAPEDLEFVRQIYARFQGVDQFDWREILAILEQEPELNNINASIQQKTFRDVG
jgi:spore coat polysaccharide biosynthesis protein SpsF